MLLNLYSLLDYKESWQVWAASLKLDIKMKMRWGLNQLHSICQDCIAIINSHTFPSISHNERRLQVLKSLSLILQIKEKHVRFFPNDESKTLHRLRSLIHPLTWEQPLVRKVLYEFWKGVTISNISNAVESLLRYITLLPPLDSNDSFPLHKAVFERNLFRIRQLCAGEDNDRIYVDIDQVDFLGNTPLMLAVKLKRYEEVLVLVDHGADPKFRLSPEDPSPLEQALGMKDRHILSVLVAGYLRNTRETWVNHQEEFKKALSEMPDFSLIMRWECNSNLIPFVKKITPSDIYRIYKKGSQVRIDLTLIGWEGLKSKRGCLSIIYDSDEGKVIIVDHNNKTCKELEIDPSNEQVERVVEKLFKKKKISGEFEIFGVNVKPEKNWKGDPVTENVKNWNCVKYKLTCKAAADMEKRQIVLDKNLQSLKTFEEYLLYSQSSSRSENFNTVLLSPKSSKHISKDITATLMACESYPLSLKSFVPLLDLLTTVSKKANKLKPFLSHSMLSEIGFPVKAIIPIYASVKVIVTFESVLIAPPEDSLFEVDLTTNKIHYEELRLESEYSNPAISEESTAKMGDRSSDFYYQCEMSCSADESLDEAQQLFLSLNSFDDAQILLDSDEDFSEISEQYVPRPLPNSQFTNATGRKSLRQVIRGADMIRKLREFIDKRPRRSDNDVDIAL
ncbi:unnamed protein product [Blepharisma stoltei]|uniref:Ankyrin repeat domain-containing protein n=1 Tax=Blepharisma stoltei TaxID=1481888 RepID=A0AAU9JK44_9CILI|nr:unnamed protein product [Blepharisma stoltei]